MKTLYFFIPGILTLTSVFFLNACSKNTDTPEPADDILFPQQDRPATGEYAFMESLIMGKLVVEDHCLRLQTNSDSIVTPVWPDYFTLVKMGDDLHVVRDGKSRAIVGNELTMGGGMVDHSTQVNGTIPETCPGPFWVVGELPE